MKKKNVLICFDRDETLIRDPYSLGRTQDWKSKIEILPGAVEGLKLINKKLPKAKIYMLTNQPGVSRKDFKLLTMERAKEVCHEVVDRLEKQGAHFKGYFFCPHASKKYRGNHKGVEFIKKLTCECECHKPGPGMIKDALRKEKFKAEDTKIYMVGDRATDVLAGLNIGGKGIHLKSRQTFAQRDKVKVLKKKYKERVYLAKNFLDCVKLILKDVK